MPNCLYSVAYKEMKRRKTTTEKGAVKVANAVSLHTYMTGPFCDGNSLVAVLSFTVSWAVSDGWGENQPRWTPRMRLA